MPILNLTTNVPANKVKPNLASDLVQVVAKALGKPASYVVVNIKPDSILNWGGSSDPAAVGRLSSIGQINRDKNKQTSKTIFAVIEKELGIPPSRFYLEFVDLNKENVGYMSTTFDDLL